MIVPVGTRVVLRVDLPGAARVYPAGTVAVIAQAPLDDTHAYRVRMTDGHETAVGRREFERLDAVKDQSLGETAAFLADYDLQQCIVFRCVVGSRAYGLDTAASDTDRRGIYLAPVRLLWSLYGAPEQLENDATQECYWELQKFVTLALKANPNILECLYTPLVEHTTPVADELRAMRTSFLSKVAYQTYNGYVWSQFKKMQQRLRNHPDPNWKHAMHLIRLLLAGITILREGVVPVRVEGERERLLAIRDGQTRWEEVDAWRQELHRRFEAAYLESRLPERPDFAQANAFLIRVRAQSARAETP